MKETKKKEKEDGKIQQIKMVIKLKKGKYINTKHNSKNLKVESLGVRATFIFNFR